MRKQRYQEADPADAYWLFNPKDCAAYVAMVGQRRETGDMPKDLKDAPLSTLVAVKGIRSSDDLIEFLGALLADVTVSHVTTEDAMACLTIADKIVEVARFSLDNQHTTKSLGSKRPLTLRGGDPG